MIVDLGDGKVGLLNTIRGAVKTADKVVKDLQPVVIFERDLGSDGAGAITYSSPVNLRAIVEDKQEIVRTLSGGLSQSKTHITFLDVDSVSAATGGQGFKESDRFTLPSGETGPILSISGFIDAGTGLPAAPEIYLG
jgi:hypothetical protein